MSTEQFEKYTSGKLIGKEKSDFEASLARNPTLQEQYDVYIMQQSYLQTQKQKAIVKQSMDNALQEFKQEHKGKVQGESGNVIEMPKEEVRKQSMLYYLIPAAVAAMLILGLFIRPLFDATSSSGNDLYANYFNPDAISLQTRSTNAASILKAEQAFNAKNYELAYQQFENLSDEANGGDPQLQFYQGISALGAGNLDEGKQILEPLLTHSVFGAGSRYYLALLMIKQDDIANAKQSLGQIPSISSYYKTAQELLQKLLSE